MSGERVDFDSERPWPDVLDQATCMACGGFLETRDRGGCRIMEFRERHWDEILRTIRLADPAVADRLESDGRVLVFHQNCTHPVEQYLPNDRERRQVA